MMCFETKVSFITLTDARDNFRNKNFALSILINVVGGKIMNIT